MKSPWKFLLNLASRGRAAEQPDSAPDVVTEQQPAPSAPAAALVATSINTTDDATSPNGGAPNEVSSDRKRETPAFVAEPVGSNETKAVLPNRTRADERQDKPERQPVSRHTRAKKLSTRNVALTTDVEYGDGNDDGPKRPMTFSDEVAALDRDIRQLRRQLAERLSLQNAQLKKMLERF